MKKSLIQNVKQKTFNQQYNKWSHVIKLENGDEGYLNCAKELNAGDEIEYNLEQKTSKNGKTYNQLSLPAKNGGFSFKGQSQAKDSILVLTAAKDLTIAMLSNGAIPENKRNSKDIVKGTISIANELLDWVKQN